MRLNQRDSPVETDELNIELARLGNKKLFIPRGIVLHAVLVLLFIKMKKE